MKVTLKIFCVLTISELDEFSFTFFDKYFSDKGSSLTEISELIWKGSSSAFFLQSKLTPSGKCFSHKYVYLLIFVTVKSVRPIKSIHFEARSMLLGLVGFTNSAHFKSGFSLISELQSLYKQ